MLFALTNARMAGVGVFIVFLIFFASGFSALLYQVAWQRLLTLVTGLDLLSVTTIVAAFMLGMGIGSLVGGQVADRLTARQLLLGFAACEAVIAAFGMVSTPLYADFLYTSVATHYAPGIVLAIACATLLLPTLCMGFTLPVLARAMTSRLDLAPARIGGLYGWNTIGAAAGAWLGIVLLVRNLGYDGAIAVGVAINIAAAAIAVILALRTTAEQAVARTPVPQGAGSPGGTAFGLWLFAYFVSGFVALGLEIIWFRLLGVLLKSTAFTFPFLLSLYLAGVGAGSLAGHYPACRSAKPLRVFLLLQAAIPAYAALSVAALVWAILNLDVQPVLTMRAYLASYEPIPFGFNFNILPADMQADMQMIYLAVPGLLILVPTFLMGLSFPYLQRAVQSDLGTLGRRVGRLQTANIIGGVGGVVVVGVVALDQLGTADTLRALGMFSAFFLVLLGWMGRSGARWPRPAPVLAAVLVAGVCFATIPGQARLWAALHGTTPAHLIQAEDASGLAVLVNTDPDFTEPTIVFVNGLGQSWIPFEGVHTDLGMIPALLHPKPLEVAVIGLGSGDTLYALAARPETRVIHSIEIVNTQRDTLAELRDRTGYGGLDGLLEDPRIRFVSGDGRGYIMRQQHGFDIIEADALRPTSAFAGNLYSVEYFELLRRHLNPGGFAVTWWASERTYQSFIQTFPYVVRFPHILIGSNEPILVDREAMLARARSQPVADHFRRAGIDAEAAVIAALAHFQGPPTSKQVAEPEQLNTDLFPRDELLGYF